MVTPQSYDRFGCSNSILEFSDRRNKIIEKLRSKEKRCLPVFCSRLGPKYQVDLQYLNKDNKTRSKIILSGQPNRLVCSPLWICRSNELDEEASQSFETQLKLFVSMMSDSHQFSVEQTLYFVMSCQYDFELAIKMADMHQDLPPSTKSYFENLLTPEDEHVMLEFLRHVPFDVEIIHKKLKKYSKKDLVHKYYLLIPQIASHQSLLDEEVFKKFDLITDKYQIAHYLNSLIYSDISIKCLNCKKLFDYFLFGNVCSFCWTIRQKHSNLKSLNINVDFDDCHHFLVSSINEQDSMIRIKKLQKDSIQNSTDRKKQIFYQLLESIKSQKKFMENSYRFLDSPNMMINDSFSKSKSSDLNYRTSQIWHKNEILRLILAHKEFGHDISQIAKILNPRSQNEISDMLELLQYS